MQSDGFEGGTQASDGRGEGPDTKPNSIVGAGTVLTGNIEASADLLIEGKVVGDVRCETLILGETSEIEGRIFATRVKVFGSVTGAIDTQDLAIEATARVNGEISYHRLRASSGGSVEGTLKRKAAEEVNKLKLVRPSAQGKASPAN